MAIDFPASPTNGQTFVVGTVTYTWDGVKWTAVAAGGGGGGGSGDKIEEGNTSAEVIDTGTDGRFVVTTEGSEALRVDPSGKLLVGTSSSVNVVGANFQQQIHSSNYAQLALVQNANVIGGSGLALAHSRGTTPGSFTSLNDGDEFGAIYFVGADGSSFTPAGAQISAYVDGTPGANDMPGRLMFSTTADGASSPTERMRINNNGWFNAIQNTTNAQPFGINNHIFSGNTNGWLFLLENTNNVDPYGMQIRFKQAAPDNGSARFLQCIDNVDTRLYINSDGDVLNHDNTYGGISDLKLKQDITDSSSQWDDIKNVRVRKFRFKSDVEQYGDDAGVRIGVIAQEIEIVSPGLVKASPNLDENNEPTGTETKTVTYSVLYMKAVKALQEAMERIETLEAKVAALEGAPSHNN